MVFTHRSEWELTTWESCSTWWRRPGDNAASTSRAAAPDWRGQTTPQVSLQLRCDLRPVLQQVLVAQQHAAALPRLRFGIQDVAQPHQEAERRFDGVAMSQ